MNFRQRLARAAPSRETVLTIGVFDGVHLGHCHLLHQLIRLAHPQYIPGVITFANHPATVVRPGFQVSHITTPDQKVRLIREQGIELVVSLDFTYELSRVSALDFVSALVDLLKLKGLVIGPDFALGRDRQGNAKFLEEAGAEMGFWVKPVEPLKMDGVLVRSRVIREAISRGDVAAAAELLGRRFYLEGPVARGHGRGQELGFPTANVEMRPQMILPGDGIYATWAVIDGVRHPAATSIGVRPTFGLTERLVEVYVLDFYGNLYGRDMGIEFVAKLRDQEIFPSLDALVDQIGRDVDNVRLALTGEEHNRVG